ncbi:VIT1/CCC1 family predicted Fe2+/Mn2+ transporter [Flavobacterium sp. CG_23.5]|uniref:VIT1/CCC1 transporter family protein n=1 Tax=unclassified Flavobacterium TaxID=196869 RepID=UPI0018C953BE|nr:MULTISPECIES: VIT1/CCC1 transporter family protein [unclassified Flavobacterium]MBG6111389.1 VIT1/CCC1 family predicted Fe2+/Mn2+ transporter [Flavobacterium sp. CG_9.10]MBP2282175.1 VIT1/CCC1 family predicted Fe2+/Mn2+ transporter [Flavobacterium sp. CG_23.5]
MDLNKLKGQLQTEVDTAFLYDSIAAIQSDDNLTRVLKSLSDIEKGHAQHMLNKVLTYDSNYHMPLPSSRAKLQLKLGKLFGYNSIISSLSSIEKQFAVNAIKNKIESGEKPTGFEHNHLKIIEAVNNNAALNVSGGFLSKFESRHKSVGGNALRAAVLGSNDGLVSNMSLVMGVAGAAVSNNTILLTGIAGLLAGAISMALGEWLSVQSSRELNQRQIDLETEELEASPEEEKKELVLLYQAKGMNIIEAQKLADKAFENPETAIDAIIIEELGIDKVELGGSAWEAAIASFVLFSIGAIIPLYPFMFLDGKNAILLSVGSSVVGLFGIGAAITLLTGKNVMFSGFRQVFFGLTAAAITYGIGSLIGVSLAG